MREIKFRAWVKPEKKFYELDVITLLYETFSKWELEELDIQQYTGLKDKIGNIYDNPELLAPTPPIKGKD